MNFEQALSLYRNDKTLQILRAETFPLLVSFFHLAFKQQDKIYYSQTDLRNLLSDYLFSLERQGVNEYQKEPLAYLQQWAQQGYLRRYYDVGDDPLYELTPATENALKWLEDLTKQEFVGTHSRLLQLFSILKQLVNTTAGQSDRIKKLEEDKTKLDIEIKEAKRGNFEKPDDTRIKEDYFLAEETAKRLLADFRQVEQNFRDLDKETRHAIIKSSQPKGKLLDDIFGKQDYLWNTDQGKSFSAFWGFLMSESMQKELEQLIEKINEIAIIKKIRRETVIEKIKTNLVDAGDKVNRTNGSLIEQLRKYVEQKSLLESKRLLKSIEEIEALLMQLKEQIDPAETLMEIDGIVKSIILMERPLFRPPVKITFEGKTVEEGMPDGDAALLFSQFHINIEELANNVRTMLRSRPLVSLKDVLENYQPTKGVAEVMGYVQIASKESKHLIYNEIIEELVIDNLETGKKFKVEAPRIIFNK
jgi:hypothetical protein